MLAILLISSAGYVKSEIKWGLSTQQGKRPAMEDPHTVKTLNKKLPKVFVIPGQNGKGLDDGYVTQVTKIPKGNIQRVGIPTSHWSIDLGQSGCTTYLKDALQNNEDDFIIYANSQGTATALNFLSQNPNHRNKCKGMVLEAVLGSGNSAIYHTITDRLGNPALKKIPALYYWAPYFAKALFIFPTYSPGGDQPIKAVENLDIDGPIIIAHSEADPQLSYKDACAMYYALRQKKKNVYLIIKEGGRHIDIFSNENDASVKNILASHGLSPAEVNSIDLRKYQPDPADHKPAYDELKARERNHVWIKRGLRSVVSIIVAYKTVKWLSDKMFQ